MGNLKTRILQSLSIYKPALLPRIDAPMYVRLKRTPLRGIPKFLFAFQERNLELVTTERIVEVPFVLSNLNLPRDAKVLDLGCNNSHFAIQLASFGYTVTGVDLNDYALSHPNLEFRRGDILELDLAPDSFDAAIAISTVEHCGLGTYGGRERVEGDAAVVKRIHELVKDGGRFLMTVPFGRSGQTAGLAGYRVYDRSALARLVADFEIIKAEYYCGTDRRHWLPVDEDALSEIDSTTKGFARGVACLAMAKRRARSSSGGAGPDASDPASRQR